jgi:putative oxidoreductase
MFITGGADALLDPGARASKAAELGGTAGAGTGCAGQRRHHAGGWCGLALGVWPRLAAATLAGALVPTTLAGHPYWREADPAIRRQQRIHFFKNVGLFGGTLLVLADRPACRR